MQHKIIIFPDSPFPKVGLYKYSIIEVSEVKKNLLQLLEQGVIQTSTSQSGSPIIIMPKKDGT